MPLSYWFFPDESMSCSHRPLTLSPVRLLSCYLLGFLCFTLYAKKREHHNKCNKSNCWFDAIHSLFICTTVQLQLQHSTSPVGIVANHYNCHFHTWFPIHMHAPFVRIEQSKLKKKIHSFCKRFFVAFFAINEIHFGWIFFILFGERDWGKLVINVIFISRTEKYENSHNSVREKNNKNPRDKYCFDSQQCYKIWED